MRLLHCAAFTGRSADNREDKHMKGVSTEPGVHAEAADCLKLRVLHDSTSGPFIMV
jgi:hypothetical protein